jgi:nucleoside-diphosphate-sugar epimerase
VLKLDTLAAAIGDSTVILSATGASPGLDPTGPYKVDYEGTKNLVDASKTQGIQHFVMVSSLCVSQIFHPTQFIWLILVWKKQAEEYLEKKRFNLHNCATRRTQK